MNNPSLNASRGGGASPPLFLKYSVSFHMRGILRSVMTAERGLGRKNVNHASCPNDMWVSVRVFLTMLLSVTDQSVRSQLLILQVGMHSLFSSCGPDIHGAPPITRRKHKHNLTSHWYSFFFYLLVTFWKQTKYALPRGKSCQPPGLASWCDFLSAGYLRYIQAP